LVFSCLLLHSWFLSPAHADAPPAGPRFIVILTDGLTADDLSNPALPHLRALAQTAQVGLMNVAVSGPRTDTNAILTLALGALAPPEPTDGDIHIATDSVEDTTADVVFARRAGVHIPNASAPTLVHLGIAGLDRRDLRANLIGAALKRGRQRPFVYVSGLTGSQPLGALFCIGERGWTANIAPTVAAALSDINASGVVVDFTDSATNDQGHAALDSLLDRLAQQASELRIILVSAHPPANAKKEWDRLPPVLIAGPRIAPGLLTSPTTRTPGLIAITDIAPTLLGWVDVPPPASMTGHTISMQTASGHLAAITDLDRAVTVNGHAQNPLFITLGIVAGIIVFGGIAALLVKPDVAPLFGFGILWLMCMPLAMLLVPLLKPTSVLIQTVETIGIMAACALLAQLLAQRFRTRLPAPITIGMLTVAFVLLDAFFGQSLVKFSLFSAYQLQGIRFYGIGNEYMGVVTGVLLLWAFAMRVRPITAGAVFLFATFVMGYPRLGANAGSVVGGAAAFGAALTVLSGKRLTFGKVALWTFLGLLAAFVLAAIDKLTPGGAPSHLGGALQAADERGYGYLLEIVFRKVMMNARIVTSPGMLAALAGIALIVLLAKTLLNDKLTALFQKYPDWARGFPTAGYAALVAFLINDSGIVAAVFLIGSFIATGLYYLLTTDESHLRLAVMDANKRE
jgi:hypothetical protein